MKTRPRCVNLPTSLTYALSVSGHGGHGVLVAAEVNVCLSVRPPFWAAFDQDLGHNQRREELQERRRHKNHVQLFSNSTSQASTFTCSLSSLVPSQCPLQTPGREDLSYGCSAAAQRSSEGILEEQTHQFSDCSNKYVHRKCWVRS